MRPAFLEIDLGAIAHNVRTIRQLVGAEVAVWPVVKANAYGHGAIPVSKATLDAGAAGLCVVLPQEAVELREAGITAPILVMGPPSPDEAPLLIEHEVTATASDETHVAIIAEAARDADAIARVHLKLDSGMGRHGVRSPLVEQVAEALAAEPHIRVEGVYSHFAMACADDLSWTRRQLEQFSTMISRLPGALMAADPILHMANSAGIVRLPEAHFDAVRPGAILYGLNPGFEPSLMPDLRPALMLRGRMATVKSVEAGAPIGYNCTYYPRQRTRIGLIPLGYADGYPRALSNNADVLVAGQRVPVVGLVSMDCVAVDLGNVPEAQLGDEAVLIGRQGDEWITVEELSVRAGSIVEELASRLTGRLPRRYVEAREGAGQ